MADRASASVGESGRHSSLKMTSKDSVRFLLECSGLQSLLATKDSSLAES